MDEMIEALYDEVRRLGDAIFCLEEIAARPEFVKILKDDLEKSKIKLSRAEEFMKSNYPSALYKKKPIPNDLRWNIFERDNFTCQSCGSRRNLTIDHIKPESKGGELTMENAQTLCKSCNSKKGNSYHE